jgi:site-specific DNA recombinase
MGPGAGAAADIRERSGADAPDRPRFWERRQAQGILTGKVVCGCCGGTMAAVGKDDFAFGKARRQGLCSNRDGIRRGDLEVLILDALRTRLMGPDILAEFIREFTAEWNRLAAERSAGRTAQERELATITRKLDGLIAAMADGFRAPRLQAQLDELEARLAILEVHLAVQQVPAPPRLHPNLAEVYR